MRDLEIRGAGNILGPEQSGHIHAVGFELYTQLLNQAVEETRVSQEGTSAASLEREAEKSQPRVSLKLSAHIPDTYISHLPTRLAVYQRLTKVSEREQVEDIREELRDRFGPMSSPVDNILYLVDLKLLAKEAEVESITQSGATATISLRESAGGAKTPLEKALGPLVRVGNQQVQFSVRGAGEGWKESLKEVLERLVAFQEQLPSVAVPG